MIDKLLKFYKAYLDRNDTFDAFVYDVDTLGGSSDEGWIQTNKKTAKVCDHNFNTIYEAPLSELWQLSKSKQIALF